MQEGATFELVMAVLYAFRFADTYRRCIEVLGLPTSFLFCKPEFSLAFVDGLLTSFQSLQRDGRSPKIRVDVSRLRLQSFTLNDFPALGFPTG
jgi:hypothetical protein